MPRVDQGIASMTSQVGVIVRSIRAEKGLTIRELGLRSGLAISTISKIEGGHLSPGYDTLLSLSRGLDIDVARLFKNYNGEVSTGRRGVNKNGSGERLETNRYVYEALASDVSNKEFLPLVTIVKPNQRVRSSDLRGHEGEEFIYVIEGCVVLYTDLYEPLNLNVGDSVYFDSRSPHAVVGLGEVNKVLWICSHRDALSNVRHEMDRGE